MMMNLRMQRRRKKKRRNNENQSSHGLVGNIVICVFEGFLTQVFVAGTAFDVERNVRLRWMWAEKACPD